MKRLGREKEYFACKSEQINIARSGIVGVDYYFYFCSFVVVVVVVVNELHFMLIFNLSCFCFKKIALTK